RLSGVRASPANKKFAPGEHRQWSQAPPFAVARHNRHSWRVRRALCLETAQALSVARSDRTIGLRRTSHSEFRRYARSWPQPGPDETARRLLRGVRNQRATTILPRTDRSAPL